MNYFEDSKTIKIETDRLALRYFTLEDCGEVARLCNNYKIHANTLFIPYPYSLRSYHN